MMNKFLYTAALAALTLTACEKDYLVEEPKLSQSTELTLSTIDGIKKAVATAYGPISSGSWYGSSMITMSEMRAGNARIPKYTQLQSGRLTTEYEWNYTASASMGGLWNTCYYAISCVNNVLANIDGKADEELVNGIKAECYFIRALAHFDLVRVFGQPYTQTDVNAANSGVPVVTTQLSGSATPARNTIAEVYAQIEADLLEAEKIIAADYNTDKVYHSKVNDYSAIASKEAIQALLSRAYLYMGEWQKSADYATKVINSSRYSLWSAADFTKAFNNEAGSGEVIFEAYIAQSNSLWGWANWELLQWESKPEGYADFGASFDIYDLYADGDVRKEMFATHPSDEFADAIWTTKYAGKDNAQPSYNNTIVLRLSEMYLNRAEAQLHGATVAGTSSAADMTAVASKRNATAEANTLMGVFTERRKEFAFEGHIIFDFARNGYAVKRVDTGAHLKEVPFPSYRWALPIPKREMDCNPNMVQNPGY